MKFRMKSLKAVFFVIVAASFFTFILAVLSVFMYDLFNCVLQ
jgi:hypothetical protein